jgi:hypothetical protein
LYAVDLLAASTCFLLAGGGDGEGELRESSGRRQEGTKTKYRTRWRMRKNQFPRYIFGYNIIYYLILDQKSPPVFTVTVCALVDSGAGLPVAGVPGLVDDQQKAS